MNDRIDDSVLWSRSREGDTGAFGLLFERHARVVYNFCFRRVGDWSVAEELVSVVFLEAWRGREKELPAGKVLPWLLGVAANVVRNRRRSERRHAAALARLPRPRPEPGHAADADARLDDERQMRTLLLLVERLPRRWRDVFVLCVFLELSYKDAALALDVPVGTVRSRLSRARQRFRELEADSGHEQGMGHPLEEPLR